MILTPRQLSNESSNELMSLIFPLSENSGGHNHGHMEVEQVCKILQYIVIVHVTLVLLLCYDAYIDSI